MTSETSDPIAENAARYALEVTEKPRVLHPWWNRLAVIAIVLFLAVGTFGAAIGTVNSFRLNRENSCQQTLLHSLTEEQQARTKIQADDRKAQNTYNEALAVAKTKQERVNAYNAYRKEAHLNELKRAMYPVPTFQSDVCNTTNGQVAVENAKSISTSSLPTPKGSPVFTNVSGHRTVVVVPGKSSMSAPTSKSSQTHSTPKVSASPTPGPTKPHSAPTKHTEPPKAVATHTPGLLNVSGCTVSVLGIKVC